MSDDLVRREEVKGALVQLYQQRAKLLDFPQRETDNTLRYINLALDAVRNLPRATAGEGVREVLEGPAWALLAQWDAFEASHGNQEEAYYKLAKYARKHWAALRDALTEGRTK